MLLSRVSVLSGHGADFVLLCLQMAEVKQKRRLSIVSCTQSGCEGAPLLRCPSKLCDKVRGFVVFSQEVGVACSREIVQHTCTCNSHANAWQKNRRAVAKRAKLHTDGAGQLGDTKMGDAKMGDAKMGDAKIGDGKMGHDKAATQTEDGDTAMGSDRDHDSDSDTESFPESAPQMYRDLLCRPFLGCETGRVTVVEYSGAPCSRVSFTLLTPFSFQTSGKSFVVLPCAMMMQTDLHSVNANSST
jgi:hypothetical protein